MHASDSCESRERLQQCCQRSNYILRNSEWSVDGGEWSVSRSGRFISFEEPSVPIQYETRWAPKPVESLRWRKKLLLLSDTCPRLFLRPFHRPAATPAFLAPVLCNIMRYNILLLSVLLLQCSLDFPCPYFSRFRFVLTDAP